VSTKTDAYRRTLGTLTDWEPFLLEESGLPGPRGNLELVQAVADAGTRRRFDAFLRWTPERAPFGSREEFLACCGTVGLGRLIADGKTDLLPRLRTLASDPRWRVRESVAMALQRFGAVDMPALLREMRAWADGNDLERRAAVAALCEPALLVRDADVRRVLRILDRITASLAAAEDRRNEPFRILRQGLAYGWSVAIAAAPDFGKPIMERWIRSDDRDVRWVMKQNLAKKRILVAGTEWVERCREMLEGGE
jgi:hypothetical protein